LYYKLTDLSFALWFDRGAQSDPWANQLHLLHINHRSINLQLIPHDLLKGHFVLSAEMLLGQITCPSVNIWFDRGAQSDPWANQVWPWLNADHQKSTDSITHHQITDQSISNSSHDLLKGHFVFSAEMLLGQITCPSVNIWFDRGAQSDPWANQLHLLHTNHRSINLQLIPHDLLKGHFVLSAEMLLGQITCTSVNIWFDRGAQSDPWANHIYA